MQVAITDAKAQLAELVRRAEAGEEIVLTRHGAPVVRLEPLRPKLDPAERERLVDEVIRRASAKCTPGPSAARSQDWLYDDDGLPK
jgi:prevent-host-death family protein